MKQRIRNLDTFRAIAAIVVMIGHIELFRQNNLGQSLFGFETYEKFFLNIKKRFER